MRPRPRRKIPADEASYSEVVEEGGKRYVQMAEFLMRRAGAKPDEALMPVLVRLRALSPAPALSTKVTTPGRPEIDRNRAALRA